MSNYSALQEAESLLVAINRALAEMRQGRPLSCQESEVEFRFDSIIGMLIIARNDAQRMFEIWEAEEES